MHSVRILYWTKTHWIVNGKYTRAHRDIHTHTLFRGQYFALSFNYCFINYFNAFFMLCIFYAFSDADSNQVCIFDVLQTKKIIQVSLFEIAIALISSVEMSSPRNWWPVLWIYCPDSHSYAICCKVVFSIRHRAYILCVSKSQIRRDCSKRRPSALIIYVFPPNRLATFSAILKWNEISSGLNKFFRPFIRQAKLK